MPNVTAPIGWVLTRSTITPDLLRERLAASRRAIKVALLDQQAMAGIGNLYASEMLHLAGIHPAAHCDRLKPAEWEALSTGALEVLELAIRYEGSTLADGTYRNALNETGGYQNQHRVYDKAGETCRRCRQGVIVRIVQAQRSTFFCPDLPTARRAADTRGVAGNHEKQQAVDPAPDRAIRPIGADRTFSSGTRWEPLVGYSRAVRVGSDDVRLGNDRDQRGGRGRRRPGDVLCASHSDAQDIETASRWPGPEIVPRRPHADLCHQYRRLGATAGRAHAEFFGQIRPATSMVEVRRSSRRKCSSKSRPTR